MFPAGAVSGAGAGGRARQEVGCSPSAVAIRSPVWGGRDEVTERAPIEASRFHGAPTLIQRGLRSPKCSVSPAWSVRT